ncbi:probable G-protein coupled receptor 132 [Protopterus annectens]|uniref:probable G-protein coupled receptor 132 n=1 Tax=Protopterus annectens TaxID=7888 RepID=UPI001CFA9B85|nr:probable G-protein coupled receptor 132 [Protopterus annectens]XP_043930297.1 probable G-protein coupled receptor 132 [Protopterus annectens]XP_043930298.1 probable G-protein coupled receptor 132 [Protopterus annectens]XP_043930299.1 probable G-protein coupled receptor 132 [Protopterus annectens]XP_043930300.1 probable G-protein coupled receptor 132 [Protopterus annectens]XP_043930301.1 probable G-protein coupled receptor 132 [Protopterus annectens]
MTSSSSGITTRSMSAATVNVTSNESHCHPQRDEVISLLISMYSIVFILGLLFNTLTAYLTWRQIRKKNILSVYLFSLSLCDLLYISTLPIWIVYFSNKHKWFYGTFACQITGFIFFTNVYLSILLLCCISIDRYVAVVYCLESRGIRRQKPAVIITLVIFIAVAIVHSPVFTMDDGVKANNSTCFETLPMNSLIAAFNYARFVIGFFIPLVVLIFTNYNIFRSTATSNGLSDAQKSKVKYLAVAVISIFLICFAPYHFILLIRAVVFTLYPNDTCWFEEKIYKSSVVFLSLATFNSIADPIIYVLASDNIRKEIMQDLLSIRSLQFKSESSTTPKCQYSKGSSDSQHVEEKPS